MTGILLIQLGTPDAPTPEALKPYLRQFLSDPRVIEDQGWKWKFILNQVILRTRPKASAAKYARIWDPAIGSPLLYFTKRQAELLQAQFNPGSAGVSPAEERPGRPRSQVPGSAGVSPAEERPGRPRSQVRFGMIVGNPSVASVVAGMIAAGVDRLVVLPMFPQY